MVEYLAHHGVKGQKWGQRQYQNSDGSLTPAGRLHYGVGVARQSVGKVAGGVKEAIRKKVAPTNAELNVQIRKQKSKNLNKQKRRELRDLKKGIDVDASSSSTKKVKGQHKRFIEMSDKDITDRINRLQNEIKLADLERTKSMGPGRRMVDEALRKAGSQALTNVMSKVFTEAGMRALSEVGKSVQSKSEDKKKTYESQLAEKKAKKALQDWNNEHPEGLSKLKPSSKRAVKEAKVAKDKEAADRRLQDEAKLAKGRQELERRAKVYKGNDISIADIAKRMNLTESQVKDLLYE